MRLPEWIRESEPDCVWDHTNLEDALSIAWKALDKTACSLADMSTSKDFNTGNLKQYLENEYQNCKEAMRRIEELGK